MEPENPYCSKLIALDYHDGPTSGVGWLLSGSTIYFKLVGWDTEQWHRLFAAVPLDSSIALGLRSTLSQYESQRLPIWVPNAGNKTPQAALIVNEFRKELHNVVEMAPDVSLVEAHDLTRDPARVASLSPRDSLLTLSSMNENQVFTLRADHMFEDFLRISHQRSGNPKGGSTL